MHHKVPVFTEAAVVTTIHGAVLRRSYVKDFDPTRLKLNKQDA